MKCIGHGNEYRCPRCVCEVGACCDRCIVPRKVAVRVKRSPVTVLLELTYLLVTCEGLTKTPVCGPSVEIDATQRERTSQERKERRDGSIGKKTS